MGLEGGTPNAGDEMPDLEAAIRSAEADAGEERRVEVLRAYATGRVAVILDRAWDGESLPDPDTRFLMVSDGPDTEQPMMAVFTSLERGRRFLEGLDTRGNFQFPTEVAGGWSLLGVPDGAGVFINPNQSPAFRIGPDAAVHLREIVQSAMDRARENDPAAEGGP